MRPKKVVLLVCADERGVSMRRLVLETRGYRVVAVVSAAEALQVLERTPMAPHQPGVSVNVLMTAVELKGMRGDELVRRAKAGWPQLQTLLYSDAVAGFALNPPGDAFLGAKTPAHEWLDLLRRLVARKRGPQKYAVTAMQPEIRRVA